MGRKRWVGWSAILVLAGLGVLAACVSAPKPGASSQEETSSISEALTSSANLLLQEETVACVANQALDFFEVTNSGTASVKVSDISIKLWVDDTTAQNIVGMINYGGCLTSSSGVCTHSVTGVAVSATHFSPACETDPTHQADWEVKISSTDTSTLAPGSSWANIQSTIHLANFANFSPGETDWYSPCVSPSTFTIDGHVAVYVAGNLVSASPGVPPPCRAPVGTMVLTGEVLPGLGSTFPLVGPLPGSTQVNLAIGLPLNAAPAGQTPLATFIQQVSDPTSPTYGQYLTPTVFAGIYGANANDYTALQNFLTANGLTVTNEHTSRALIGATGTAAAIENAFFVTLNVYRRPDGTTFYAAANQPSLNLTLSSPILHITGFDSFSVASPSSDTSNVTCPNSGLKRFYGPDLRTQYLGCDLTLFGTGQTIALFEADSFNPANVQTYAAGTNLGEVAINAPAGLSNVKQVVVPFSSGATLTAVPIGTTPIFTPFTQAGESEVEIGIEMLLAMAPQANIVVYEQNLGQSAGLIYPDFLLAALEESVPGTTAPPQIIANSWTWPALVPDANISQALEQFAAQGQSYFQASGDLGSYVAGGALANVPDPMMESSLMTVVGGTAIVPNPTRTSTWNDFASRPATCTLPLTTSGQVPVTTLENGTCNSVGGGGFCTGYASIPTLSVPSYQLGVTGTANPTMTRMIPDVSMMADNLATVTATTVAKTGVAGTAGCSQGTSASAALWAGYAAIANQQAVTVGQGVVGFANPKLYFLQASAGSFNDVTVGDNNFTGTGSFAAGSNYDLATGLGEPNGLSCTVLGGLPTQSCMPGTSVSALIPTNVAAGAFNVIAYVPIGSYEEPGTGIGVVPLEQAPTTLNPKQWATTLSSLGGVIPTGTDVINTCAGNSVNGEVVCASNGTNIYFVDGTQPIATQIAAVPNSISDATVSSGVEQFSGGTCQTCNVAIDPLHNKAYLSIATNGDEGQDTTGAAILPVKLPANLTNFTSNPPTLLSVIETNQQATTEDLLVDPLRNLILSPNEGYLETSGGAGDYQLISTSTSGVFDFSPPNAPAGTGGVGAGGTGSGLDSAAEDCLTGIALATDEFTDQVFLVDLNQVAFSGTTWTASTAGTPGFGFFPIPEFSAFAGNIDEAGTSGVSVVASGTHLGVITGEFGGGTFIAIQLPAHGGGTPTLQDYVLATLPPTPDGLAWGFGKDPHTVTAYQSPNSGKPYAVFEDDVDILGAGDGRRTFIGVVDLTALLARARQAPPNNHLLVTDLAQADTCSVIDATTGVNPSGCVVRWVGSATGL